MPTVRRSRGSRFNSKRSYRYPYEDNNGLASEKYPGKIIFRAIKREVPAAIDVSDLVTYTGATGRSSIAFDEGELFEAQAKRGKVKNRVLGSVSLALPPGLNFVDEMQYENAELNAANFAAMGASRTFAQSPGGAIQRLQAAARSSASTVTDEFRAGKADALELGAGQLGRFLGGMTGTRYGVMIGSSQAPRLHTYSMFRNVNLRNFNFNFNMLPTSSAEASEIEKIVEFFRYHMYPDTLGGNILSAYKFPTIFEIELFYGNTEIAPKILPCYLTSFNTTYNGETTSFHHDGKFTQTSIAMSYQEEHNLVRDDIERGY